MLIQCTISNFLSFKEKVVFSMTKGGQRKHNKHVIQPEAIGYINALKTGVIYGANASGKSNFVKALEFIQDLIVKGTQSNDVINRKPFALDEDSCKRPTEFSFIFCANNKCFSYGIEFIDKYILREWLFEVLKTTEKKLFEREFVHEKSVYSFGNWINNLGTEDKQYINFIAKGTRPNQPFLKESVDRQINEFQNAYQWFRDSVQIIFPDTQLNICQYFLDKNNSFIESTFISLLRDFGTGIVDFELKELNITETLPKDVFLDLDKSLTKNTMALLTKGRSRARAFIRRNHSTNELEAYQLVLKHQGESNRTIQIDPNDESDGTIRLIDLLPILDESKTKPCVFIIDEFDRSIHPNLSYKFLQLFLEHLNNQNQLVVTTHEENLLDLELLRRDEIWFIEKDFHGSSHMYSLEEFQPRYDKDIRKGYLQGRFGAIPVLRTPKFCKGE